MPHESGDQRSAPSVHIIVKPVGSVCNLNCTYCFYLEKENLYPHTKYFRMSDVVLESFIRQRIKTHPAQDVNFVWQGGEPTLFGLDHFRRIVELQKKYANGKTIENAFQTNGVLLDDAWCEFFKENHFLIGLSIDGPEAIHDAYRLTKNGQGSFKQVMRGLECLKKHQVEFNTLTAVQQKNACYPLEVYQFLKEVGSGFMQFIPTVERVVQDASSLVLPGFKAEARITEWSVDAEQYGDFLIAIFDEWTQNDVGRQYVQIFDIALEAWIGRSVSLCVFRETCGDALAVEHNGDLYSCDHFVYPENKLGNIMESPLMALISSENQIRFGKDKRDKLPKYCRTCDVRFVCNGGCPKNRFIKTPHGEEGLNYLCAGYKKFFRHIDSSMRFMANELRWQRPPSNIMARAKGRHNS